VRLDARGAPGAESTADATAILRGGGLELVEDIGLLEEVTAWPNGPVVVAVPDGPGLSWNCRLK